MPIRAWIWKDKRRQGHGLAVGLQDEDRPEPHGDGFPVVVFLADQPGPDEGGRQAGDDRQDQHGVHEFVVPGGGHEHRALGAASVDQNRRTGQGGDPGDAAEGDRLDVITHLAQPECAGPALGNDETDDVPEDHHQDAEVEQRAADPQQPALVELGGAGGPAEFVVPVSPPGADHQDRDGHIGYDVPEHGADVHPDPFRTPMVRANGSRPTDSAGGPCMASLRASFRSAAVAGGRVADTASMTPA